MCHKALSWVGQTEEESNPNCSDHQGDDRHDNDELVEVDSEAACDESRSVGANVLYSVCFKCIGTTKEQSYQDILAEAAQKKRAGINVEVRLSPEPHNPFDANLIAFEILVNAEWKRVGYMVSEVLNAVHQALHNKEIVLV